MAPSLPPQWPLRFFRWFCHPAFLEDIEGDLAETFYRNVERVGSHRARWIFFWQVVKLLRPALMRPLFSTRHLNSFGMFKNYFYTAIRHMKREKLFAIMNIAGLAMGIGCGLAIYKIVQYERSYDRYQKNYDHIYRVVNKYTHPEFGIVYQAGQPHPLGDALTNDFGIETTMTFYAKDAQITVQDVHGNPERFQEYQGVAYAGPNFFHVFDYSFVAGDARTALVNRGSVVITESLARKYFKLKEHETGVALGRGLTVNNSTNFVVTGVVKDVPSNSDIPFTLIGSYPDQTASNPYFRNGTDWNEYHSDINCYALIPDASTAASLPNLLPNFLLKYAGKDRAAFQEYQLQPMADLHFDSKLANYSGRKISYQQIGILIVIGLFLVISACINFVNLSTAQAINRSREIGVRKALGVKRGQLVSQFLGETILISGIAAVVGLGVAQLLFLNIDDILGYSLSLSPIANPSEVMFLMGMVAVVGLVSGLYPALVMAGMDPVKALKNTLSVRSTSGLFSLRRTLVIIQFVISQVLIIGTIVASRQMEYFMGNDIGFSHSAILITKLPDASPAQLDLLRNTISAQPGVESVSLSVASPMSRFRVSNEFQHPSVQKDDRQMANLKTADENYIDLFHLKLIAGRNLPQEKDTKDAVVNRMMTKSLGYENPEAALGDTFLYGRGDLKFRIIGVVEDFHSDSFHNPMENVILSNLPWNIKEMAVKLKTSQGSTFSDMQTSIEAIRTAWDKILPEAIFDFNFLDQQIAQLYRDEQRKSKLFQLFSIIAIFIGCLGLYGLIAYMANQKTKEIGIRKVLGASISSIFGIFSREMLLLVSIAFLIAAPVAWYAMRSWLQGFKFQVPLSIGFFLLSLGISLLIAMITIGYRAIAASLVNPVESLKNE